MSADDLAKALAAIPGSVTSLDLRRNDFGNMNGDDLLTFFHNLSQQRPHIHIDMEVFLRLQKNSQTTKDFALVLQMINGALSNHDANPSNNRDTEQLSEFLCNTLEKMATLNEPLVILDTLLQACLSSGTLLSDTFAFELLSWLDTETPYFFQVASLSDLSNDDLRTFVQGRYQNVIPQHNITTPTQPELKADMLSRLTQADSKYTGSFFNHLAASKKHTELLNTYCDRTLYSNLM